MSEMIFYFKIEGDTLKLLDVKDRASTGNVNSYICDFSKNDDWEALQAFAVFGVEDRMYCAAISENRCYIPHEILENEGEILVGVYGTNASESNLKRISTNLERITVNKGAYREEFISSTPSELNMWETLLNKNIPKIGQNKKWYIWDVEAGEYVDSGILAEGKDGYTPLRGKDFYTDEDKRELIKEIEKTSIGDIETVLDNIIAIQETLIGGESV